MGYVHRWFLLYEEKLVIRYDSTHDDHALNFVLMKVNVGNDFEMTQSERNSHSKK